MNNKILTLAIACFFSTFIITISEAAVISKIDGRVLNCAFLVEGPIQKGDAAVLKAILENQDSHSWDSSPNGPVRVCLNSPGGAFNEALKMARVIFDAFVGTAIRRNERCESACSIIFMAGTIDNESDVGKYPDRVLHPLGTLGFHAPSLSVPDGQYRSLEVNRAYKIALGGIAELMSVSRKVSFPDSLLEEMIRTPPETMRYIKTVGEAAQWNIQVAPTVTPKIIGKSAIANLCHNWEYGELASYAHKLGFEVTLSNSNGIKATMKGFRQEAATDCFVEFNEDFPFKLGMGWKRLGWVSMGEDNRSFFSSILYDGHTPIAKLAPSNDAIVEYVAVRKNDSNSIQPSSNNNQNSSATKQGECTVFRRGKLIDEEACSRVVETREGTSGGSQKISYFIWPSGAKTILEQGRNGVEINGNATNISPHPNGGEGLCALNPKSGNRFCFYPNR